MDREQFQMRQDRDQDGVPDTSKLMAPEGSATESVTLIQMATVGSVGDDDAVIRGLIETAIDDGHTSTGEDVAPRRPPIRNPRGPHRLLHYRAMNATFLAFSLEQYTNKWRVPIQG